MYKIQTLNKISAVGLEKLPREMYEVGSTIGEADAILVRSADMKASPISPTVKAVARAGAGTNNIPVSELTERGVVVFNTPGANANAVKELVILALLMSNRPVVEANKWVEGLKGKGDEIADLAEKGKSQFVGNELKGKTLGVIGLGAIGALVANTAVDLGMTVVGYDPFMSIAAAWRLSRAVQHAETLEALLARSDYITIHIPQTADNKGFLNAEKIKQMKDGVHVVNFARGGLVVNADILAAIDSGKVSTFITDFAAEELLGHKGIVCLPHLGASTPEAEENCAVMAVEELKDFLERGIIVNSVNFPKTTTENPIPKGGTRLCVSHRNIPEMISKFTTLLGDARLNIDAMINQNRGDVAYNIIDVDGKVDASTLARLEAIENVTGARAIEG